MHIGALLRFGLGLFAVLSIAACGNSDPGDDNGDEDPTDGVELVPGTGQTGASRAIYPEGPKGVNEGSIIENLRYVGYFNAMNNPTGQLQMIQMSDFYNPTGTDLYPAGHALAGQPKPTALLISVASVWCGPCNYEAGEILPDLYAKYKPMGGEFMLQLADSATAGEPATVNNLNKWTTKYQVDYPSTIDPTYKLDALFEQSAFPQNFIIDTRTMKIVKVFAGAAEPGDGGLGDAFWNKFEDVIAGTY